MSATHTSILPRSRADRIRRDRAAVVARAARDAANGRRGTAAAGGAVTVGPSVSAGFLILDGALMILRQPV
jgi:hypothetical protein